MFYAFGADTLLGHRLAQHSQAKARTAGAGLVLAAGSHACGQPGRERMDCRTKMGAIFSNVENTRRIILIYRLYLYMSSRNIVFRRLNYPGLFL